MIRELTVAGIFLRVLLAVILGGIIGLYEVAAAGGLAVFIVLTALHELDFRMRSRSHIIEMYVELDAGMPLGEFLQNARERDLELSNMQLEHDHIIAGKTLSFVVTIKGKKHQNQTEMFQNVQKMEGVKHLEML